MESKPCFLCGTQCQFSSTVEPEIAYFECAVCGKYKLKGFQIMRAASLSQFLQEIGDVDLQDKIYIISALARRNYLENPESYISFNGVPDINNLIASNSIPNSPLDKLDILLSYFYKKSEFFNKTVFINSETDYPLCFAKNADEMWGLLEAASSLGYIKKPSSIDTIEQMIGMHYVLTLKGWERVKEIRKNRPSGNQCFIAMWFDEAFFSDVFPWIKQAVEENDYEVECIGTKMHNNKICDEIMAGIRKSSLVIADMTDERFAVSFEAGFAMGLSIPVIFTCKVGTDIEKNFDIKQYPHIIWKNKEELKSKLTERIQALYPLRMPCSGK